MRNGRNMNFREITLEDKVWIDPLLAESDFRGCDYTFANLFIWKDQFREMIACVEGMLCVRRWEPETGRYMYLFPAGNGNLQAAIDFMTEDAASLGEKLYIRGFTKKEAEKIKQLFPERFQFECIRDEWDYLYNVQDLSELVGRKYHAKRNHISKFLNTGEWKYESLDESNMAECYEMHKQWYHERVTDDGAESSMDNDAVEKAFQYFKELGLVGGVLYQFGRVVAFTMGTHLSSDTFVVHIEKAFADAAGAYPMINQQFVLDKMKNYQFVNREEDLGVEGLRRAKESYYPAMMVEKCIAIEK